TEGWRRGIAVLRGGRPQCASARLASEDAVVKVAPEQAELPELIGEVLANVGHDAIRPDNDLFTRVIGPSKLAFGPSKIAFFGPSKLGPYVVALLFDPHHPAARQPAFGLEKHGALRFENLECARPELQPQDVALVRQQIVRNVQA